MCDLCGGTTFCQLNVCSDCKSSIDNMDQNFNSLQQLKAEIATLEKEMSAWYMANDTDEKEWVSVREKMRQLSAV